MNRRVVFFDGVCGFCNGFVDFILERDHKRKFLFSPVQGETAAGVLPPLPDDFRKWSIFYSDRDGICRDSTAVIKILTGLGGAWPLFGVFMYVPGFIRDSIYRRIASNRYRWFGNLDSCRLPPPEHSDRFLP